MMSAIENTQAFAEAPASFNVKLVSPDGYDCMMTLRGASGAELLPKVEQVLEWAKSHGYRPTANGRGNPSRGGSNGHPEQGGSNPTKGGSNSHTEAQAKSDDPDVLTDERGKSYKVCEVHQARMYAKTGKGGQVWYSHPLASGEWCKGKKN